MHVIHYTEKKKAKHHIIFSIDTENAVDEIQNPLMIKTLIKVGIGESSLNIIKTIYNKLTGSSTNIGEKLNFFSKIQNETRMPALQLLFNIFKIVYILTTGINKKK